MSTGHRHDVGRGTADTTFRVYLGDQLLAEVVRTTTKTVAGLVVLSVVEQRLDAFRAVLGGVDVVEMAASVGVHAPVARGVEGGATAFLVVGQATRRRLSGKVLAPGRP
jgi:hypothetical protein